MYLKKSKIGLFADDTTIYFSSTLIDTAKSVIIDDVGVICEWFDFNRLTVNWRKTNGMIINRNADKPSDFCFEVRGKKVEFVPEFKLLGLTIDQRLTFDSHIAVIRKKINYKSYLISKTRSFFPLAFRITLHKLLDLPHLEYCSTVYHCRISKTRFDTLLKSFHRSLRFSLRIKVSSRSDLAVSSSILGKYKLLPLQLRLFRRLCIFTF